MSKLTSKYAFFKPDLTDPADITAFNSNWDKIDEQLSNNANGIEELSVAMSNITNYYEATVLE